MAKLEYTNFKTDKLPSVEHEGGANPGMVVNYPYGSVYAD